jgi:drug/metabolite transporter (DMT)-like permease
LFAFLTPLFDVLAGAALLHEQIAAPFVLPAALVATGSALVDRRA